MKFLNKKSVRLKKANKQTATEKPQHHNCYWWSCQEEYDRMGSILRGDVSKPCCC